MVLSKWEIGQKQFCYAKKDESHSTLFEQWWLQLWTLLSKNWNIFSPSLWAGTKSKLQLKLIPDEGQEMGPLMNTGDKSSTAHCAWANKYDGKN